MKKTFIAATLGALSCVTFAATIAETTRAMSSQSGLFDVYRDQDNGRVLLTIKQWQQPFLLSTSLPYGLGSNDVGLDRGQLGNMRLVEFRRYGKKVMLVQRNTRFVAHSNDEAERQSVLEAFAESVLWSGDVIANDGDNKTLVDFSSFLLADQHGAAKRLQDSKQGSYKVDDKRSAILLEQIKNFPRNTEFEVLLTLAGGNNGDYVNQVAMDSESVSLHQHISLVQLPETGFTPRVYHPFSGGIDVGYIDFATPLSDTLDKRFQARFRLQKNNAGEVLTPIIFYLDRGTPEPVRSALLEGARWWSSAFDKAGFKNGYRVELMPPDIDPMDIRYNTIQWVHRATRGWSYGSFLADPRNGEIMKGAVTLGSQRVRQDILIAESLLAPYGKANETALKQQAEAMALARLRQLAAHEVGHTLGFSHNFAASRQENGSVMDYPHPMLSLTPAQTIQLTSAYGVGVGEWDDYVVRHAYTEFNADTEIAELEKLREHIRERGFRYSSDADARAPNSAHPDGLLWDYGSQSLPTFDALLRVREVALNHFSSAVLPPNRQAGEIEARLVPVYLLHRYQTDAVVRLLGGVNYEYGVAGDRHSGSAVVSASQQREALSRVIKTLQAETLAIPDAVVKLMTPPSNGYERSREYFSTQMAPVFDALAAVESAAALSAQLLFEPARLNRMAWQSASDPKQLSVSEMLNTVFNATWKAHRKDEKNPSLATVQLTANWVVLDSLIASLDSGQLHPVVVADIRMQLQNWRQYLQQSALGKPHAQYREAAKYIDDYLANAVQFKRRSKPVIPPGAPI